MTILYVLLAMLFILIFIVGCLTCFVCGFTVAQREEIKREPKPPPELTEEQITAIERKQREYENFMKYDGSDQG